jgi:hypothetical protein
MHRRKTNNGVDIEPLFHLFRCLDAPFLAQLRQHACENYIHQQRMIRHQGNIDVSKWGVKSMYSAKAYVREGKTHSCDRRLGRHLCTSEIIQETGGGCGLGEARMSSPIVGDEISLSLHRRGRTQPSRMPANTTLYQKGIRWTSG